jgi:hypothetical protein
VVNFLPVQSHPKESVVYALPDAAGREIFADGVDHVEVVGPNVKIVLYTERLVLGEPERREAFTLIVPWQSLPGGVTGLRQAFGDRVLPPLPRNLS